MIVPSCKCITLDGVHALGCVEARLLCQMRADNDDVKLEVAFDGMLY